MPYRSHALGSPTARLPASNTGWGFGDGGVSGTVCLVCDAGEGARGCGIAGVELGEGIGVIDEQVLNK